MKHSGPTSLVGEQVIFVTSKDEPIWQGHIVGVDCMSYDLMIVVDHIILHPCVRDTVKVGKILGLNDWSDIRLSQSLANESARQIDEEVDKED